ncbi:MAG: S41 family peptidase, partial [Planctomycetales bacterium]|nr:S41 family peptidase [Planctomycetales bacterium]
NLTIIMFALLLSIACYTRASRNRYAATLLDAMNIIESEYVDDVEPRKLFEGAMDGMVNQLDPYSGYSQPEEYQQFQEQMDQGFVGIGVFVEIDPKSKRLTIMSPLVGSPAFKAGIKSGDVIMAINDIDTTGMTLKESTSHIKGRAGTIVKLSVQHLGEAAPVEIPVERAEIPIESVYGDIRGKDGKWIFHLQEKRNIGYIRIHTFGERTATETEAALESFSEPDQGVDALILDLRGNAGGLLNSAIDICDQFLEDGVIVSTKGRNNLERSRTVANPGVKISPDIPMVVLVDKFSASASEIVAACLQDHQRAVVVGQRSWGKGTVQNIIKLEGGKSALRLTVARYSRPSGKNIHKGADAKDTDDWGVSPNPGLAVNLTNDQFETWVKARRQRDIMTYSGQAKSSVAPTEKKTKEEGTKEETKSDPESKSPDSAVGPPTPPPEEPEPKEIKVEPASHSDPQLQKAIEYLQERLLKASEPRPA